MADILTQSEKSQIRVSCPIELALGASSSAICSADTRRQSCYLPTSPSVVTS